MSAPRFGHKRRFIAFGVLNITITNGLLQSLLAFNFSTVMAGQENSQTGFCWPP